MQTEAHQPQSIPSTTEALGSLAQATPPSTGSKNQEFVTFGTALTLCLFTALITLLIAIFGPAIAAKHGISVPGVGVQHKVVYLDFEKVLMAGVERSLKSNQGADDLKQQAEKFQVDIAAVTKAYADAGYVVLNSKALIVGSSEQDITAQVMRDLGAK